MFKMYLDINGLPCENTWTAMAKIINDDHYIRCFSRTTGGLPVNPHGAAFNLQTIKPNSSFAEHPTRYQKVTEECFEHYVKYLQSKNDLFYRNTLRLGSF